MKARAQQSDGDDDNDADSAPDAEAERFTRAMAGVVPLAPDPRGRVQATPQVTTTRPATPSTSKSIGDDGEGVAESSFVAPGVDRRELRKIKRGEQTPSRRLDLHGQTATEAVTSVTRFIDSGRHHHRCVCIVHGRGLHSRDNVAILRTRVRDVLRQHPAVLAYADAPRTGGGPGAVYVLLRK